MEALQNGKYFISCDWGSSNLRLQLVDKEKLHAVAETNSAEGIASVYSNWKATHADRFNFFKAIIDKHITNLESQSAISLGKTPLIISGMASATIGMQEIPYKKMPFSTDGSDLEYRIIDNTIIISGARTENDVMRGEETQVVGVGEQVASEGFVILPGTHSKHVVIKDRKAIGVQTFMTGELFQLLCEKSVLSGSVIQSGDSTKYSDHFVQGVKHSLRHNFLNSIFSARTNILLDKLSPEQNYFYLSGITIGEELKNITARHIHIIGSKIMNELYALALRVLYPNTAIICIPAKTAIIVGQHKILQYVK